MKFLKHNWKLKLLCLALAVMVNVYVRRQEVPARSTIFLPVTIQPPPGQRVEEPPPGTRVRVDLQGPAEEIRNLRSEDVTLALDLSGVRPGRRTLVPVTVELAEKYRDSVTVDWRPRTVPVRLSADAVRKLRVVLKPLDRAEGWQIAEPPRAEPPEVTVTGREEVVARVAQVVAPFHLKPSATIDVLAPLQAVDASGNSVSDDTLRIEPFQVHITGMQERVVWRKQVPVQPLFEVPPGFQVSAVEVVPKRARLTGPERAVSDVYVVETRPFQIPTGRLQSTQEVPLVPPSAGVELLPSSVEVTVRLQPLRPGGARPTVPAGEGSAGGPTSRS